MPFPESYKRLSALLLTALLSLLLIAGCQNALPGEPARPTALSSAAITRAPSPTATPAITPSVTALATRINPSPTTVTGRSTLRPTNTVLASDCVYSPITQQIIDAVTTESWMEWVKQLSGAAPATVHGKQVTITTRLSTALFNGQSNAQAFDYVLEQLRGWYPDSQIQVIPYTVTIPSKDATYTWKNLVLTLPGTSKAGETVILSAHLDSSARKNAEQIAPGAEDNASGSAALLEAARIFRAYQFERTVQIIWFTGEEQSMLGSKAYVDQIKEPASILGVVNLDMFGYDSDGDRCFEIHAGSLPQSNVVGQCFIQSIDAYALGLPHYDYLTKNAVRGSDHSSFWSRHIGAIEILENMFDNKLIEAGQPNACAGKDPNPDYHSAADTADKVNANTAIRIVHAALATVAGLAGPVQVSR